MSTACPKKISEENEDERQRQLEEAQDELVFGNNLEQDSAKQPPEHDPKKIVKRFTDAYPLLLEAVMGGLALPVVLPQRRFHIGLL